MKEVAFQFCFNRSHNVLRTTYQTQSKLQSCPYNLRNILEQCAIAAASNVLHSLARRQI